MATTDPAESPSLPRPSPLDLRHAQQFRNRFDACDELETMIMLAWPRGGVRWRPADRRYLQSITLIRALKTFDGSLHLAAAGYGQQASMLGRSLFEDMVVAHWAMGTPDEILLEKMARHEKSVALYFQSDARTLPSGLADMHRLPEERVREIEQAEGISSRDALRHWTGKTLHQMVKEAGVRLPPEEQALLEEMHDLANRLSNLLLHHSPLSLNSAFTGNVELAGETAAMLSRRPSDRGVGDALRLAFYSLARLGRLVVGDRAGDDLDAAIKRFDPLFRELTAGQLASAGRNDPCPCGSGRKLKVCHGR